MTQTATPTTVPAFDNVSLTPAALEAALAALAAGTSGDSSAEELAARVRDWFGGAGELARGPDAKVDEPTVAWAVQASLESGDDVSVRVLADDGSFALPLARVGGSGVFAGVATLSPGTAMRWNYEVTAHGRRTLLPDIPEEQRRRIRGSGRPLEVYATHPDGRPQPGTPHGTLTAYQGWQGAVFPRTTRDWWLYVPAQYRPEEPACVMVFQDGARPKDYVPAVFDNLIAGGDMPVTAGVFIDPGVLPDGGRNRSFEYDTLSDQYARFLLDEILPEVEKSVRLRHDAASRAISGISSGGICSFTVAWQRPDAFSKVLSWVGSFTNIAAGESGIAGGHNYPAMIRRSPPKPIRVFLQDGENDLNVVAGDWWLANQQMASALAFAGYDFANAWGKGFHSDKHGRAILPDSLRWLWRGYRG